MDFMTTERLLDKLEEILNSGKKQMFSNMRLVDANSCLAIVQQIRSQLPTELSEAIVILRDCDKLKENAEHEANEIINDAHERAQMLVSESREKLKLLQVWNCVNRNYRSVTGAKKLSLMPVIPG